MLYKSGKNNLSKHFVKTILCVALALGALGVGSKAYAYQEIPPVPGGKPDKVYITEFGCAGKTCSIRTNVGKNHWVTSDGTASCDRGIFAWNKTQHPELTTAAQKAFSQRIPVRLRYSEYRCYDGTKDGFGKTMELGVIWLVR